MKATTETSEKEFQDSEIPDGRSPVSEFIVADNAVKATTETSEKKFQDSEIPDGRSLNSVIQRL